MSNTKNKVRPFLKWIGGKRQIMGELMKYKPNSFSRYIEGMVGGGAFFYELGELNLEIPIIINDINTELIDAYRTIKHNVEDLISELKNGTYIYDKDRFYAIREWDRQENFSERSLIEKSARLIFLNRTCFNGLYRVNQKGFFNSPFGRYTNPTICDESNLRKVSDYLQKVHIFNMDFTKISSICQFDDFIYLDPPYIALSKTSNFKEYGKDGFSWEDQNNLMKFAKKMAEKGCKVMLSNSGNPIIKELYEDPIFKIKEILAKRSVNSVSKKRGKIKEVIITTY